jgi:hypothetical protein
VCSLLQLLLGAEVGGVSARLLAAIGRPGVESGVALAADHLVAGLPIKNPPKKTQKKAIKNGFLGFFGSKFLIFYKNNTNFPLWNRFFMNK